MTTEKNVKTKSFPVNQTCCGDNFAINKNLELLCCIPETNIICQLYLNTNKYVTKDIIFLKSLSLSGFRCPFLY